MRIWAVAVARSGRGSKPFMIYRGGQESLLGADLVDLTAGLLNFSHRNRELQPFRSRKRYRAGATRTSARCCR